MPVTGVNTDALESGIRSAITGGGDAAPSNGLLESIKALFPDTKPSGATPVATPAAAQTPARPVDPDSVQGTVQGTIVEAARRHGVDPSVMLGLAQSESGFDPGAVSPTGATGLYQFTKRTAKAYGVDRKDPASSADGAARYMKELLARHDGDVSAALRDYKGVAVGGATEGNVRDTLGKIERYRSGGFTAPAPATNTAPATSDDAAMQRYLSDTSDLTAPAQLAATQTSQPYIDFGPVPGASADAKAGEPGARLQSLLTSLGIQPAHGDEQTGLLRQGNIDLSHRPIVYNPDGSISTVRSISIGTDEGEVLIPTVTDDGRLLSNKEAIESYHRTGQHLGVFDDEGHATAYAQRLHKQQEAYYLPKAGGGFPRITPNAHPENISRGTEAQADAARGGLATIIGSVNSALRMGGAAIVKSVAGQEGIDAMKAGLGLARKADEKIAPRIAADKSGGPFPNDPVQNAGAQILEGAVKTLTGGLGQTAFPKTSEAIEAATSTGEPALDRALQAAGSTGLFATPLAPIAIGAGVAGTGVRVAEGEETPLAGIGDVATTMTGLKGFKAASELQNIGKRIVANVLVSEGMEAAGSAVHGQVPTVEGMVGAGVGGLAFGVASHPPADGPKTFAEAEAKITSDAAEKIKSGTDKEVAAAAKANIDATAHEAATSPLNERPEPTPAQTEAGNYKKGHVTMQGLDISIENPQGSVRSGVGSDGQPWQTTLKDHYGYIKGTTGADGDHVDTFIGPDPKSDKVFIVDQVRPASEVAAGAKREGMDAAATAPEFDEHKVVLGAKSKAEATEIYKRNFSDDATPRIGAVTEATMPEFKRWLKDGDTTRPFTEFEHGTGSASAATDTARNESIDPGQPSEGVSEPGAGDAGSRDIARADTGDGQTALSGDAGPAREGSLTRDQFSSAVKSKFKLSADEHAAVMALSDARAEQWAKENDRKPDEYYPERIAGITNEAAPDGSLNQLLDLDVYHGTKQPFDRFSDEKIGTGEGTQFEGHGHYVTENRKTAEWYAKEITDIHSNRDGRYPDEFELGSGHNVTWAADQFGHKGTLTELGAKRIIDLSRNAADNLRRVLRTNNGGNDFFLDEQLLKRDRYEAVAAMSPQDAIRKISEVSPYRKTVIRGHIRGEFVDLDGRTSDEQDLYNKVRDLYAKRMEDAPSHTWNQPKFNVENLDVDGQYGWDGKWGPPPGFTPKNHRWETVYNRISHALSSQEASRMFREAGIDGLRYRGDERAGSYHNYVVFNPEQIKVHGHDTLEQRDGESANAAVHFRADGKAVIHAFEGANVSSVAHELAHVWRRDLPQNLLRDAETAIGVKEGKWSEGHEEQFARGFERYLRDGNAPTAKLKIVFENFKQWLTNIYRKLRNSPLEKRVSPELKRVFDEMLVGKPESAREPITLHDTGHDTHIRVGDAKMPAKYALVEARDVQLSHDPATFARNPDYVGENQNNYDSDKAMQASVERGIADTDWDTIHSQTKTSTEGPTTIDEFGQAAGGNGRGMIQKGVYEVRPEEAKNAAIQNAPRFGLDAAKAARMDQPMIVRVQPEIVSKSVESRRNIAAHNASVTKSRTPVVDGVDLAKRLTPENKSALAEALLGVERMSDLNKKDALARPIIKVLRDAGQITHTNQAEYITPDGTLTHKGSETVEGAFVGMAIPDAALVERLPAGFRQKLAENLPTLGAVESTKGWELHDNLARVVDYNEARQAFVDRGGVKSMYDKQGSLLPSSERAPELTSEDHTLLTLLEDPKRTQFKEFMKSYAAKAEEARSGAMDFSGEPMTRERAFTEAAEALQIKERTGIAGYFDKTKAEDEAYIKEHLGKSLSMNIDPVLGARIMRRIAGWIADGVHDTAQLSARALEEWGDRIKSDLDELLDGARTMFVANKGEGLRGGLADLAEAYMRKPEQTTMKRVIGTFQGNVEAREIDLRNLDRDILARVPDGGFTGTKAAAYKQERLAAMKVFWEAGGGGNELFSEHTMNETLAQWAAQSSAKNVKKYQDALNLTDHEKLLAREMGARQMRNGEAAVEAGVLDKMVDNYAHNVWEHDPRRAKSLIAMAQSVEFDPNPSVTLHKIFANTFEGEQAGFTAKEGHTSLLRSLIENERALGNAIDTRIAIHDMMQSKEADGQPSVIIGGDALPIKGEPVGEAEDAGVLRAQPLKALLIRPNSLGEVNRELYKEFDHRAMRKWKWVASDLNGKPILMRGNAWVHKDAWSKMNNFLGQSKLRDLTIPDDIPVIGGTQPIEAYRKAQSTVKATLLQGGFHEFHLETHALFHNTGIIDLPEIDFNARPLLREGVEHGLTLMMTKAYREGVEPGGLLHYVPGYDETMGRYVKWFFGDRLPRLKAKAFETAWEQNKKHYEGKLLDGSITKDQLLDITANQVNAAYGGINTKYPGGPSSKIFSNPTVRDLMGLTMLAPDFLDARIRSLGQAMRPYGHAQRMSLLRGALYTSLTAQITNVMFGDDHKMHLDHPFQVLIGGRWYGPRTEVGDIMHMYNDPTSFVYTRISPFGHAAVEIGSGHNSFGEKVGRGEAALEVLKSWVPIPAQAIVKNDKHWKEQTLLANVMNGLLNSVGISNFENRSGLESFVRERFFATLPQTRRSGAAQTIADAKSDLRDAYRAGKPGKVAQLQQKYGFTEKQMKAAERQSKESPLVYDFGRLTLAEMAQAFDDHVTDIQALPASDRSRMQVLFGHRITNAAGAEMPEATKAEYRQKYNLPE